MLSDLLFTIFLDHDPLHLAFATLVCITGSFLTVRMLRACGQNGAAQRPYWAGLLGIIGGGTIWTTHFIAVLGFRPEILTGHDQLRVAASLFVAIGAMLAAVTFASAVRHRHAREGGGVLLGLGIAAMHYTGMSGFAMACGVALDPLQAVIAVLLGCAGGALAFNRTLRSTHCSCLQGTGAMVGAVVLLHFTAISALELDPAQILPIPDSYFTGDGMTLPVVLVMGLVLVVGLTSMQIDRISGEESIARLRRAARRDPLTALPNRTGFGEAFEHLRGPGGRLGPHLLIAVDLDGFKFVNDTHGHAAGDALLRETARRIEGWMPPGAFAARIGGDEFYVAVPGTISPAAAHGTGASLVAALGQPVLLDDKTLRVHASLGMILCPAHAADAADLFSGADLALYESKRAGRNRATLFDPEMARRHRERRELGDDLIRAVESDALMVHYQPQLDFHSGRIVGFEALLRWTHPVRGPISPEDFVPIAEERGLISELGTWVLRNAAREAAGWTLDCRIAVNVAAAQFAGGALPRIVREVLAETGLAPHRLDLEITESTVIDDVEEVQRQVAELKALGVGLAMDDYGTGYSALSTLLALPFDKIKFDRSFTERLDADARMIGVLRSAVELGRQLGISVLAEGVETAGQARILADLGCDEIQGYLIGAPVCAGQARAQFGLDRSEAELWHLDLAREAGAPAAARAPRLAAGGT